MCILCVIQKWSRRVATMLPWLVLPLIGLWALSQLLPPAFRFEITSPRLACVFVLLVTLFWYEVLMPQLSTWRLQRNARLRERKRMEAMELQKLKKTATRRCRNCSTPYKEQNPGGGRFMCSYCGHVSKRPVLDMHVGVPVPTSSSSLGLLKGRKEGWEWTENSNWSNGIGSESMYTFGEDESCLEKSYPGGVVFACKLLTSLFMSIRWLWRKVCNSSVDESLSEGEERLGRVENGTSCHESRIEKARRKAEEKRQARLEKEHLEEEERKQREEVAKLVEERRKLRDEITIAESKSSAISKEKDTKEKKRQERRKEKERDRASSKSNSDVEEVDKRTEHNKQRQQHTPDNFKKHGHGVDSNNATSGRYFDRVKGTLFSSSKALTDNRFFGRGVMPTTTTTTTSTVVKENNKPIGSTTQSRHINPPEFVAAKSVSNGGEKTTNRPVSVLTPQVVVTEPQPKKSWQQLFARSPSVPAVTPSSNVISRPNTKPQPSTVPTSQDHSIRTFDNPISFGLPSPFPIPPYSSGSNIGIIGFSPARDAAVLPQPVEKPRGLIHEEEHFEDPCYVPDPISLLGPISESLDLRAKFENVAKYENGIGVKPSPIESPLSKLRVAADEKQQVNDGSWQMWKTTFGQDLLLPLDNRSNNNDSRTSSLFANDDPIHHSQRNGGAFTSPIGGPSKSNNNHDPWSQKMFLPASSGTESLLSYSRPEEGGGHGFMSPTGLAPENPFEHPSPNHWLKKVKKSEDGNGRQYVEGELMINQDVQSFW